MKPTGIYPTRSNLAAAAAAPATVARGRINTTRRANRFATAASNAKLAAFAPAAPPAVGGPGSVAAATAAPAVSGYYVYYTGLSKFVGDQPVFVAPIEDLTKAERTDLITANLQNLIKDNVGLCAGNVIDDYLIEALETNEILCVISPDKILSTGGRASRLRPTILPKCAGYIVAQKLMSTRPFGIYLDVICTEPGKGTHLLKFFETLAFQNGYAFIQLSSLANVLTYYSSPKLGYEFRTSCNGKPLTELSAKLKSRNFKAKPAPRNTASAYKNANYLEFMVHELHPLGLTVSENDDCSENMLNENSFIESDCASDGFTMMRCNPDIHKRKAGGKRRTIRKKR